MERLNKISGTYYISMKLDNDTFGYVRSSSIIGKKKEDDNKINPKFYKINRTLLHNTFSGIKDQFYAAMNTLYYDLISPEADKSELVNLFFVVFDTGVKESVRTCDGYFIRCDSIDDLTKDDKFNKLYKEYVLEEDDKVKASSAVFNFGYVTNHMIDINNLLEDKFEFVVSKLQYNSITVIDQKIQFDEDDVFSFEADKISNNDVLKYVINTTQVNLEV